VVFEGGDVAILPKCEVEMIEEGKEDEGKEGLSKRCKKIAGA
jgi:hypothetical protein